MTPLTAITVRGPFRGPSGHDHHVREFVRELDRQGIAVQLVDLPGWHPATLPENARDPWFDSLGADCGAAVAVHFSMPHQVEPYRGLVNVNYTMFEASRVPEDWVRANRKHDLVIVPAESSRAAWLASGMPAEKIRICPLGINPVLFSGTVTPMDLAIPGHRTRFLNVAELGPRKNVSGLLRAWMKATRASDDAVLILKLGRYGIADKLLPYLIKAAEREAGKELREAAPVHFVEGMFSDGEMPGLYAAATHYISLSFGEGWDQAMMEAAASGLRLIAPAHSAYTAYLDDSVATMIQSRAVSAEHWGDPATAAFFKTAEWWQPDEEQAAGCIRAEIDGSGEAKESARERVLAEFTWEKATRRLIALLSELLSNKTKRRRFWLLP